MGRRRDPRLTRMSGQVAGLDRAPYARRLARQVLNAPARLPAGALDKAKVCLLDLIGCAFEARSLPWSTRALALARPVADGVPIIGHDRLFHPADAAFVNATMGHGLVREDMHAASVSHHGVVIWPVLLALAGERQVDGRSLLTAAIMGYEAGAKIGRVLFDAGLSRLFRPTSFAGLLGATIAGAWLLRLSEDETTAALSLAANMAGGLNQWPASGADEMYYHPGIAARNTLLAVGLAQAGSYASEDIFEGEAGLFQAFKRAPFHEPEALFANGTAEILAVYNKPAPACNFAQSACQAAVQVANAIDGNAEEVQGIIIRVPEAAARYPGCDYRGPFRRALQAKMSIQYGVAAALVRGVVEEDNYRQLDEARILALVARSRLETDAAFTAAFPSRQAAEVIVVLRDGRNVARRLDDVIPASPDEVRQRFHRAASIVLGERRAASLAALIDHLEDIRDAGEVARQCRQEAGAAAAPNLRRA